jgi:hypothetical protein
MRGTCVLEGCGGEMTEYISGKFSCPRLGPEAILVNLE